MEEAVIKRIMPNNPKAEEAVIGSMLLDEEAIIHASEKLIDSDFYNPRFRTLFSAIVELYHENKPADLVTLTDRLRKNNVTGDICSVEFLSNIISAVPTSANIRYYTDIVQQKSLLRSLIRTTEEIANRSYQDTADIEALMEDTERDIFQLIQGRASQEDFTPIREVALEALESIQDEDKILISEGCTHRRQCNDIGTVKLPMWIRRHTGKEPEFSFTSGMEFPADLSSYKLIVHCGGCMLNEREMRYRLGCACDAGVPITNYGILIAYMNGILERSLEGIG